jgi:hypothetical protein
MEEAQRELKLNPCDYRKNNNRDLFCGLEFVSILGTGPFTPPARAWRRTSSRDFDSNLLHLEPVTE